MEATGFDIAVLGSDPLSLLCAGILAEQHGRRVCLVSRPFAQGQLPRGVDLSVAPATRPALWQLALRVVPETRALLERIGAGAAILPSEPMLIGSHPATLEALQHMRHVASGSGARITRVADVDIGEGAVGYRFSGDFQLDRARLIPTLLAWLETLGVHLSGPISGPVTLRRDGSVRLPVEDRMLLAGEAVFLDAEAIGAHLPASARDPILNLDPARAILTEPARPLSSGAMIYLDRGATLTQASDGSITALLRGDPDSAAARLGACLPAQGLLRRSAEASFLVSDCGDGAPLVGTVRGSRARIVAGLGPWAAFLAPLLARWMVGAAEPAEASILAAFASQRGTPRPAVADFSVPRCLAGFS
ncbi:hypothetical protein SAMN02983003_3033 [Devosia enhydra]|uniref:Glycine/D-amino acid oxidase n=1 Tax=Devosia enhydra TaxID=665118 RepID=A0A1K2I0E6_9HYPH|nr:hypothetical protein [Devosia enhydra]SFZ85861.1 hypothetical protein SAMN02983003_3033 [Devosia enhydra]